MERRILQGAEDSSGDQIAGHADDEELAEPRSGGTRESLQPRIVA